MRVFLIGFMSAGKTTLGERLAERLGLPFFDLDGFVERRAGKPIPEIFAEQGETGFREHESSALRELVRREDNGVFATGGGTFAVEANRALIKSSGLSIWLDVPAARLMERCRGGEGRPMYRGSDDALALLDDRRGHYALADERVELAGRDMDEDSERLFALIANQNEIS